MNYYCYILYSPKSKRTYTGITNNTKRRLKEHNLGKHIYTKTYGPWIILSSIKCKDRVEARRKELYFKSSAGRKQISKLYSGIV